MVPGPLIERHLGIILEAQMAIARRDQDQATGQELVGLGMEDSEGRDFIQMLGHRVGEQGTHVLHHDHRCRKIGGQLGQDFAQGTWSPCGSTDPDNQLIFIFPIHFTPQSLGCVCGFPHQD